MTTFPIQIDATELVYRYFLIPGVTPNWISSRTIQTLALEPGTYNFQVGSGYYTDFTSGTRNGKSSPRSKVQSLSFEDLLRLNEQGNAKARDALKRMADYLGQGLALLVNGLAPDVIVVVGGVTRAWRDVGELIEDSVKQHSFTRATTRIMPSDPISQPRLRGTIALVLQKHFGAPSVA